MIPDDKKNTSFMVFHSLALFPVRRSIAEPARAGGERGNKEQAGGAVVLQRSWEHENPLKTTALEFYLLCVISLSDYCGSVQGRWVLPIFAQSEITPAVSRLLDIVREMKEELDKQKDEIARLKGLKGKPKIKPSGMDKRQKTSGF
jgi:hypothetical protein